MDQARYSLWAKRSKPDSNSYILAPAPPAPPAQAPVNSYGDSWEEKAFAEDAAGSLGGCVWPPRSYSCSFCRREFRSAQALGGHMNVHRRDRARLKQSSISPPHAVEVVPHQNHGTTPCSTHHDMSFDANLYSSGIRSFLYNNPDPEIRVSSSPPKNKEEEGPTLSFLTPMFQQNHVINHAIQSLPPQSWSSFVSKKRDRFALDLIKNNIVEKEAVTDKDHCVAEDNLSRSLNLVVAFEPTVKASKDDEVASCKRRRIEENPLSLLRKLSWMDKCINYVHQPDDLDLELRLGDAPKVK